MVTQTVDRGTAGGGALESVPSSVAQPQKLPHLEGMVTLLEEIDRISETMGEDRSGDWSGSGATGGGMMQAGGQTGTSPRDQAIAALPMPNVMKRHLEAHIVREMKTLRRDIRRITRVRTPGAAYKLNELYTRLRRLHGLLHDILEASFEVLRRLFIKVFVDKQPII